ncbi:terminase TerL endonuclease subunit [Segatella salivae]|uniref:terminase TerL endonuclease subunit n=1 Tax=Segatella salivae TaxID=228604 RepID=UPI0028E8E5D5|nr:terminase TerL endonuclease subunit [Segatella salivae]
MTEEEKKELRALKLSCSERLQASIDNYTKKYSYALVGTDRRLLDYVICTAKNPEAHNLYELLGVERFFQLLGRYEWKPKRVRHFIRFYEALRFSGLKGRTRYKLTPVQVFQFANIYGFAMKDGRRLIRVAYLFVPRKFSKTTSSASMAVYDLLFGDSNAQAYVGANSYDQAKICFDEIRALMWDIDPSGRHFRVNREKITFCDRHHDSLIQCLTANAKTKDGLFASLVIMDEYAQARNTAGKNGADLKNVLTTSMGPRREPLTIIITTASDVVDGPFANELDGVLKVLRGEVENDKMFASVFMPDVDDAEDDPVTWAKVQPHLGVTVQPDYYAYAYKEAQLSAENMLAFRTKLLNIFTVNESKTWFTYEQATALLGDFDIDKVEGHPECAIAFDLSVHDDFSAVTYTLYSATQKKFFSHTDYYFPEGALKGHPNEQLYRRWNEQGHLVFCKGKKIDTRRITEDVLRRSKKLNIIRIGYDAYKAQELVSILSSVGARNVLTPYRQTYGSFNLPVESFELLAYEEPPKITLNNNPINVFCLTNCVIDEDNLGNKKPLKITQYRKIDGVITLLMTLGLLYSYER